MGADRPLGVFVGLATLDVLHHVERPPGRNEKVTAHRQFCAAGGPAANAAVTFARLGGRAVLGTVLGTSTLAQAVSAELRSHGVTVVDLDPDTPAPVPVSAVAVTTGTGDRSIVSIDATAGRVVSTRAVEHRVHPWLDQADVVLVDGHHPEAAVLTVAGAARRGLPTVVDAGRWKPVMSEILTATVDAVCSADFRVPDTHDEVSSARALQRRGTARVVVTRGQRPVQWWDGDRSGTTPVPQVVVRDTLGAGDAFHGAYAHARARNLSVPEAVDLAVAVASLRVRFPGPRSWLDHLDDLTVPAGAPQERTS